MTVPSLETGRFAPSTTGPAHPGTLLAALLCWLDARSRGARLVLRLEDLDPERCRPEWADAMRADLAWLGLDWDAETTQSEAEGRHAEALDALEAVGRLYPCACSRKTVRAAGERAPDGSFRYPNTCRGRPLPPGGWRSAREPLRAQLPEGIVCIADESGLDLSRDPSADFGDPVVRRRDGAVAYHLASVADDAAAGVTRVVRGRDLADTTATQVALQRLLGLPEPRYRHHLLLLEEREAAPRCAAEPERDARAQGASEPGRPRRKLAKLHGAVSAEALRAHYDAPALVGVLAFAAGLLECPEPARPRDLLAHFDWSRVGEEDRVLHWMGEGLVAEERAAPGPRRGRPPERRGSGR